MKDTCYLIMDANGVTDIRKTHPSLKSGQIAVKLKVNVSDKFFERTFPVAELNIPDSYVLEPSIDVELEGLPEGDDER